MMDDSGSGSGMDESNSPRSTNEEQTLNPRIVSLDVAPAHVRPIVSEAGGLIPTDHPNVYCTPLPHHCRVNSPIHVPFLVVSTKAIPDGTLLRLSAGNKFNPVAEMKNCEALMAEQVAKFPDLRFVGRSGRGRRLNVKIEFLTEPNFIAVYENAIKVTADGPREPRRHKQHPYAVDRHPKSPVDFNNRDWLLPIESPECTSQRSPHSVDSGTEEDVPMNAEAANLLLSSVTGSYGSRKDHKQFLGNPISDNSFKRNSVNQHPGIGHGIITIDNIAASTESGGLGNSTPSSPSHNVQKAPISQLLPHRVLILPTSPTVVSPPGSATLPNQPNTYSINGKVPSLNPNKMASTVDGHKVQFVPVSSGKGGMQLQHVMLPSTPPASNGTTQSYLNFIPISPKLVSSSPLLQPITSLNQALASPRLTTSPENGSDIVQNVSYLKGLDHKGILKLLRLMDLEKYHQMFIQEHVDGELLSSMSELDLEELGVKSSLHKKRFLKLIEGKHSAKDYLEKGNPYYEDV